MSRLSQTIWFITADEMPTKQEMEHYYTAISKNQDLVELRKNYRKWAKSENVMNPSSSEERYENGIYFMNTQT